MTKLSNDLSKRTDCPICTALDIVGDRWTLLIIRDIGLFGRHKNKEFQLAGENIPTNILADRLKQMVKTGLIEKRPYQNNPPRYEYHLTPPGQALVPVIEAMAMWAEQNVEGISIANYRDIEAQDSKPQ